MAYQISRIMLKKFSPEETKPNEEDIDSRSVRPFTKKFFRFEANGYLYTFIQDMATPWPTLEMAEKKMTELEKSFVRFSTVEHGSTLRRPFEIRVVEVAEAIRQSWIRKGLLPPEQSVKQEPLVNHLGENENKFLHPNAGDGSTGKTDGR